MRILFIGDIIGKPGREAALSLVPGLREEFDIDIVVANAENVAGGWGITASIAHALLNGGMDVLTMGNHTWSKLDGVDVLDGEPRVLRPANYPPGTPGRGYGLFKTRSGKMIGVANLNGRVFMEPLDDPFRIADEIIAALCPHTRVMLFDFHAETTSEKVAFGYHCDGRVSAVLGTHTHVQTADERILPRGTAYITDTGMCGPEHSVIGMEIETVLLRFRTQMPHRFKVAEGDAVLNGVIIDVDDHSGKALSIHRIARRD
ncbi:MAG: TIGR00282 family metallophosphoesterase [Armatimonadaceae bacterium]